MIECSANALLYKRSEVEEYFFRAARMLMQSVRYLNLLCCLAGSGTNASDVTTTTKVRFFFEVMPASNKRKLHPSHRGATSCEKKQHYNCY